MSNPPRFNVETNDSLSAEMLELVDLVAHLPEPHQSRFDPVLTRVIETTQRRRRILSLVQDALSQLRLDMKYLVFDLEATRRERDGYRESLEEESNRDDD